MSSRTDPSDMLEDDLEKFKKMQSGDGMDTSFPAIAELVFVTLAGLVVIGWLVAMFFVPDTISGETWMTGGMVGLLLFGLPAGVIVALRRGGAQMIMAMIRDYAG